MVWSPSSGGRGNIFLCRGFRRPFLAFPPGGRLSGGPVCRPYEILWPFCRGQSQTGPRAADSRPYIGKRPRTLVRKRQAQKRNRSNCNFPHSQAPVGRKEPLTATQILRAGNFLPNLRDNPRNGGSRGWGTWRMRRSRIRLAPPPSAFLVTFWASKKSLAAHRRRNPPQKH